MCSFKLDLRVPCVCGSWEGFAVEKSGQDVVRCRECSRFQYNAPRTETGKRQRSVSTTHAAIKPKQRARILNRDARRCVMCGQSAEHAVVNVGHIVSVEEGHLQELPDELINADENLVTMCEECNLGQGNRTVSLRLAEAILRAQQRVKR